MKKIIALALLASLAACGGGGGSSPIPQPSNAPVTQRHVSFAVIGKVQSVGGAHAQSIRALDTNTVAQEPVEIAVAPSSPTGISAGVGDVSAAVEVKVTDQNGNAVQEPQPTAVVANTSVATVSATPSPSASASPAPPTVEVGGSTQSGQTALNVAFPDGTQGAIPVNVYQQFAVAEEGAFNDAHPAVSIDASGAIVRASDTTADVWVSSPQAPFNGDSTPTLHCPYGCEFLPATAPIGAFLSASSFASTGTSITISDLSTAVGSFQDWTMVFKSASGRFGKVRICSVQYGGVVAGAAGVSDASGNFAY